MEKKEILTKELEESITQKIGPIVLEYIFPLALAQPLELAILVFEQIGLKVQISKKQNKAIINGFRFEIMGIIIESNLLNIIRNATNIKQ